MMISNDFYLCQLKHNTTQPKYKVNFIVPPWKTECLFHDFNVKWLENKGGPTINFYRKYVDCNHPVIASGEDELAGEVRT